MALKVSKVDVWAGDLRDVPGGLADALERNAAGGRNIEFLIARRDDKQSGVGKVFITPVSGARAENAATRAGLRRAEDVATLRIEGMDSPGMGSKITRAIADAGINVRGVSAAAIGSRFVAYFGFDSEADADAAMTAIRNAKLNGAPRKRAAAGRSAAKKPARLRTSTRARR